MTTLQQLLPDVDVLLAFAPEELAPYLLEVMKSQLQNGMCTLGNLTLVSLKQQCQGNLSAFALRRTRERHRVSRFRSLELVAMYKV